jgi:hypothetical protein
MQTLSEATARIEIQPRFFSLVYTYDPNDAVYEIPEGPWKLEVWVTEKSLPTWSSSEQRLVPRVHYEIRPGVIEIITLPNYLPEPIEILTILGYEIRGNCQPETWRWKK